MARVRTCLLLAVRDVGGYDMDNYYSRLRYHQMFIPRFVERAIKTAPPGADVRSWRY